MLSWMDEPTCSIRSLILVKLNCTDLSDWMPNITTHTIWQILEKLRSTPNLFLNLLSIYPVAQRLLELCTQKMESRF